MNHPFAAPFLLHGGDYNPEQWLDAPEILEKDLEYFEKTGIRPHKYTHVLSPSFDVSKSATKTRSLRTLAHSFAVSSAQSI